MNDLPLQDYLARSGLKIVRTLGHGKDGVVFATTRSSAVKKLKLQPVYQRELRAYKLLQQLSIDRIATLNLPRLISNDDEALAIEMTIVSPPFILDFAATYDEVDLEYLGFTDDVWSEREQHWSDAFGEHWPYVRTICNTFLQLTGLMYLDPTRNNIRLS